MKFLVFLALFISVVAAGRMHPHHTAGTAVSEYSKQLLKIEALRNRRLQNPFPLKDSLPSALNVELMRQKRQEDITQEISQLLEDTRSKASAIQRLQRKAHQSSF